jgi:hypothetical protein
MRRFGLNIVSRKEPFEFDLLLRFAEAYGVRHHGCCHRVASKMAVVVCGGMYRCDDAPLLLWRRDVGFNADGSGFELSFNKRKNTQFGQGNTILVTSSPLGVVCPVRLLREMEMFTGRPEAGLHVFHGCIGRMVVKSPRTSAPGPTRIAYDQLLTL